MLRSTRKARRIIFWIWLRGVHARQCYCQALHDQLDLGPAQGEKYCLSGYPDSQLLTLSAGCVSILIAALRVGIDVNATYLGHGRVWQL